MQNEGEWEKREGGREARQNKIEESGDVEGGQVRVKMEGGRKILSMDTVEVAGRRTKETRKEKPKGDDRQVERRRKFISKEMWDDAPE